MKIIETIFETQSALRESLLLHFTDGGMFVRGDWQVSLGDPVLVRVDARGLGTAVLIEGEVQSRRTKRAAACEHGLAPGVGVRFVATEKTRFEFLRAWSEQAADGSGRTDLRFPVRLPVRVSLMTSGRLAATVLHGDLRDVSSHGACVALPALVLPGQFVSLEVEVDQTATAFKCRVTWATERCAGLRLLPDGAAESARWEQFTLRALRAYEA